MNIASIKVCDTANGPGLRTSVFVSGCRRHCTGCFNEVAWDFEYGEHASYKTIRYILDSVNSPNVDGISLLGGEPFEPENASTCAMLATGTKFEGKSVWTYTGFTFEELLYRVQTHDYDSVSDLLYATDVLVDGPFIEAEKDISLKFRGSRNQRIIDVLASIKEGKPVLLEEYI